MINANGLKQPDTDWPPDSKPTSWWVVDVVASRSGRFPPPSDPGGQNPSTLAVPLASPLRLVLRGIDRTRP